VLQSLHVISFGKDFYRRAASFARPHQNPAGSLMGFVMTSSFREKQAHRQSFVIIATPASYSEHGRGDY